MTIRPLRDRILVKREDAESVTKGGIILPDGSKTERPQKGTVLAVGPGKLLISPMGQPLREPMSCEVGDVVIFTKYSGDGYKFGGEELFLIQEQDLVAVCEPDEPEDPYTADELIEEFEGDNEGGLFVSAENFDLVRGAVRNYPATEAERIDGAHAATACFMAEPEPRPNSFSRDQLVDQLTVFRPDTTPEHLSAGL